MYIGLGLFLLVDGVFMLWCGTAGAEWANTHTRLGQRRSRYSDSQVQLNTVMARVAGPLLMVGGAAMAVVATVHAVG